MAALVSSPPLAVKALLTRRSKNDVRVWYVIKYGNALRAIRARPERASENECQQRVLATGRGDTELLNQICGIPDRYDISERALQEKKERKTQKRKKKQKETERERKGRIKDVVYCTKKETYSKYMTIGTWLIHQCSFVPSGNLYCTPKIE